MRRFVTLLAATVLAAAAHGQTTINGGRRIQGVWDASGASASKPARTGAGLPGSCEVGEQYFRTDAPAGQNLHLCTAPGTWTAISGGAATGETLTVNTAAAASPNLNDSVPAAPASGANRGINVRWQMDAGAPDNVSAYVPYNSYLMPLPSVRAWAAFAPSGHPGGTLTSFGDIYSPDGTLSGIAPTNTEGQLTKFATAATAGQPAGMNGYSKWRTGFNLYLSAVVRLQQTADVRAWIGLLNAQNSDTMGGSTGGAAFRYSTTAGDANWTCVVQNSSTTSTANSGVAVNTSGTQRFEIIFDDNASPRTVTFRINGAQVCQFNAASHNVPATGQNLPYGIRIWTQANEEKDIYIHDLFVSADR